MDEQKQRPSQSDEVDLAQFFRWIGRGFSNLGNSIVGGIAGLRNQFVDNRVFFTGIIALGLVLGTLYSTLLKKDFYMSSMVLSCDYLNTQILENTINKFNLLAKEEDRAGLMAELKIDSMTAGNIRAFDFKPFVSEDDVVEMEVLRAQLQASAPDKGKLIDDVIQKLVVTSKHAYEISVYVYDPSFVKPLEGALVDYFRQSSYIDRRIQIRHVSLNDRKRKLEEELRKLDSLKSVLFQNYMAFSQKNRGSNNVVVGTDDALANPLEVFSRDLELYSELQSVNQSLFLSPDFELVDGFTSFQAPVSASLPDILAISLFLSIIIGYLILGAYRFDKMLAEYPTRKKR